MTDFKRVLEMHPAALEKTLSYKTDRAVFQVRFEDGRRRILRLYRSDIPVYRQLKGHTCSCLPQVLNVSVTDEIFVVEEEFIDGVSLQEMIAGGAIMDEPRTCQIALKICSAARFLHGMGFIHRDIKPEHVMLTADGGLYLMDLDAAMRILPGKDTDTQLLGTAMYAAPEQFGLSRSDERTDVYAVGMLLNELLTGNHPAVTRYEGGPLKEVISRCIQMNPQDRYQSMEELENELQKLQKRWEPKAAGKRKKPVLALVGVILCLLIGAFALLPQSREEYLPLYGDLSHQYDLYRNFRMGSQSRKLYTEENILVDETWDVYADKNVGQITGWNTTCEGWTLNSEGCDMGAAGFIHAEHNGYHYVMPVQVQGEPMSAYDSLPSQKDITEGYLQPEETEGFEYPGVVTVPYNPAKETTIYLVAMKGFVDLQPFCDSSLITIEPCEEAADWELPVYRMTFKNPEGGTVRLRVDSNHTSLQFIFEEK